MKVFISIPISGHDIEKQKKKCEEVKARIHDCEVLTPFDKPGWEPDHTWEWYMARTLKMIEGCDLVYFCEGWALSKGCRLESQWATCLHKAIILEPSQPEPTHTCGVF